ncbi:MAG: hypothetical protein AB1631_29850 [Acidobacteriota bacterium]
MLGSFINGIMQASRSWKIILLLLAANMLFSLPMAVLVFLFVMKSAGGTIFAQRLFADNLDAVWFSDVINDRIPGASLAGAGIDLLVMMCVMALVYLIANAFFAGGIIEVLASEDRGFTMKKFFSGCGHCFWRFFRLLLVATIFYGIAIGIFVLLLMRIDSADKLSTVERPGALKTLAAALLLLALMALVGAIQDYARIGAMLNDRRKMWREWFKSARFVFRRFLSAYSLYVLIAVAGLMVFGLIAWLRGGVNQNSSLNIFLAFLLGQLAIASRMWTRITFYAAEIDLYRKLSLSSATTEAASTERAEPGEATA